ncbi:GNAT family N-acetyltransferase [Litoreibacter roseus]|uniref:Acetyltransferase n=1 Tax=Litoreibacter roseus TaxID=2601869 RepID=A0A6N6JM18_9RHOB|nr:GNAT family N-acetyltransferase [Litoreibacter roseus]GFE67353.1 acetyltransferase [Litoreibacter roseus]
MQLVRPAYDHLSAYRDALERGWSPNNLRPEAAQEQLIEIERDPDDFLSKMEDRSAQAGPVKLPDGSTVERLPSIRRWIWDTSFCGSIALRWRPDSNDLPPTCLGHIGYAVVPWRRGEGLATAALRAMLPEARDVGLSRLTITTDPENLASRRVIEKNGGQFVRQDTRPAQLGGGDDLVFHIDLSE